MDHGYPTKTGAPMAFCKYFALALNEVPNAPTDPCATHQLVCVREHSTHTIHSTIQTHKDLISPFLRFSHHNTQSKNHHTAETTQSFGLTLSVSPHSERSDHTIKKTTAQEQKPNNNQASRQITLYIFFH